MWENAIRNAHRWMRPWPPDPPRRRRVIVRIEDPRQHPVPVAFLPDPYRVSNPPPPLRHKSPIPSHNIRYVGEELTNHRRSMPCGRHKKNEATAWVPIVVSQSTLLFLSTSNIQSNPPRFSSYLSTVVLCPWHGFCFFFWIFTTSEMWGSWKKLHTHS